MSDDDTKGESIARTRGRRDRSDKSGRNAALEKLKNLRGAKNKYEVRDVNAVYDIVDEATYSKKVNDRLKDDWIIDDGTGLYTEHGMEMFDDDLVDEFEGPDSKRDKRRNTDKKSKISKEERDNQKAGFKSLRDMWGTMASKRKRDDNEASTVKVDDDLDELMQELHEEKKPKLLSSGFKLLEKSKTDSFLSGRIKDDNDAYKKSSPVAPKKKFIPFKVPIPNPIKEELVDIIDDGMDVHIMDMDMDVVASTSFDSNKNQNATNSFEEQQSTSKNVNRTVVNIKTKVPSVNIKNEMPDSNNSEGFSKVQQKFHFDPSENFEEMGCIQIEDMKVNITDVVDASCNVTDESGNQIIKFYWLDMFEEPKNPGVLYLFGKIAVSSDKFASCCIVVKNLDRCIYLLPRSELADGTPISLIDIYREFDNEVAPKFKISKFKSKKIEKKYCFDLADVPHFSEYMEIRYSGALPHLPGDFSGRTFSRVFGASSPLMENFLLEKKFKGPSWLKVSNAMKVESGQQHSWCKFEFTCETEDVILDVDNSRPAPPLMLVSLNVQTVNDPGTKKDTIVFVGAAIYPNFKIHSQLQEGQWFRDHFCLFNKPPGEVWPLDVEKKVITNRQTSKLDSERALLGCLLAKLQQYDTDVFVGHDLNFELLIMQLIAHKVPNWSRIGRLKRSSNVSKSNKVLDYRSVMAGRLMCDVKISAKELIRARSYDLPTLATQLLEINEDRVVTLSGPEIRELYNSSYGLNYLKNLGMTQAVTCIRLIDRLQVLPLALQITAIAGNTLLRTLLGGRAERNEYLLLHAFYSKGYIVPDKFKPFNRRFKQEPGTAGEEDQNKDEKKSSGPAYVGGLVLNPKKGFYDNFIVLMDFNSLYPSIIQEFNICFTTSAASNEASNEPSGVLPEEIRKLVESRRQVKNLMKDESVSADMMRQYDIRQKALKLTANSMYGCLGFKFSRFYAKELAASVTAKGREILLKTKDVVEKLGFEVIYGDTDSLMINSNTQDIQKVYQIGNKIKSEVNRMYKLLELEIDGIFRFLLLLKKKKYAALLHHQKANGEIEQVMELKGLDIVRRDWAPVAANTAKRILKEIMTEQSLDDKVFKCSEILSEVAIQLRAEQVPIKDLLITKQLAKNPEEYKASQGLYHVQVALRMNKSGKMTKKFKTGDTVPYLFCTDGLAHHTRELEESQSQNSDLKAEPESEDKKIDPDAVKILKPDASYYLSQQVHPVVSRICEPIPGLDAAQIAESLGLDPSSYKKRRFVEDESHEDKLLGEQSDAEKYRDCEKFSFQCQTIGCGQNITFESPFVGTDNEINCILATCSGCGTPPYQYIGNIGNKLTLFMRKFVGKYYKNTHYCEDPSCNYSDRGFLLNSNTISGHHRCSECNNALIVPEYRAELLYVQLRYLENLFDISKHEENLKTKTEKDIIAAFWKSNPKCLGAYLQLRDTVTKVLQRSAYSQILLADIFNKIRISKIEKM